MWRAILSVNERKGKCRHMIQVLERGGNDQHRAPGSGRFENRQPWRMEAVPLEREPDRAAIDKMEFGWIMG